MTASRDGGFSKREAALAPAIMVQGTASSVGKSLLVTALCRMFRQDGLRVVPFKAQNMALNSAVTSDGGEIGRAQAAQAEAAGVPSVVDMNPILLKPEGDARSQVVVLGKAVGSMTALEYHARKPELRSLISECLLRLRQSSDVVVIEGAGSPAEINLKDRDIVNMSVAKAADAPVLLVGDIDRGGVFASFVGTMELLEPDERARVAAFVVNKFRGDVELLRPGLDYLTGRTGVPVLGVVPYVRGLRIADEDSVSLDERSGRPRGSARASIDIAVVRLPRISNYDDFDPLEHEQGVAVRFVDRADELEPSDLVIVPGSKSTVSDLEWLVESDFARRLEARAARGEWILGVCGGCQMLGVSIEDPHGVESKRPSVPGLRLLPVRTRFERSKVTAQVGATLRTPTFLSPHAGCEATGYEIHMGRSLAVDDAPPLFEITSRNGESCSALDGSVGAGGAVVGTMIHGLFENARIREGLIESLRARKGVARSDGASLVPTRDAEYDRLAQVVRAHVDQALLRRLLHPRAST
jgi:adenosylcobyric acid synthase